MKFKTWLKSSKGSPPKKWLLELLALCFVTTVSSGQGTTRAAITFDGPAYPGAPAPTPRGIELNTAAYSEAGIVFWNLQAPQGVALTGGGIASLPDNGTPYLGMGVGGGLGFEFSDLRIFDLVSLDLGEGPTNFPDPVTVHVAALSASAPVWLTADITTDGINDGTGPLTDFETFMFGDLFHDVFRVQITGGGFSLDNVVIQVPEPSAGALAVLGAVFVLARRRSRPR